MAGRFPRRRRSRGSCCPRAATFLLISSAAQGLRLSCLFHRRRGSAGSVGAGECLLAEKPDRSGRQARGGARHEQIELFRARCQHGANLFPCQRHASAGLGGAPLEGAEEGRAANENIAGQKVAGVTGWAIAYNQLQPCVDTVVASHDFSAGRPCERRDPSPLASKVKKGLGSSVELPSQPSLMLQEQAVYRMASIPLRRMTSSNTRAGPVGRLAPRSSFET